MTPENAPKLDRDDTRDPSELDEDELFGRLTGWFKTDLPHAAEWREEYMAPAYDFYAGEQYTDAEKEALKAKKRPDVVFNRVGVIVDAVTGAEVNNRQEVRYLPRTVSDTGVTDNYSAAGRYFRQQAHAEDEESDAWQDAVIAGMGWTETRLEFTMDPDGAYVQERIDPGEMVWDCTAKKRNLTDAKHLFRARTMPLKEAMELFPDDDPWELDAPWGRGEEGSKVRTTKVRYRTDAGDIDVDCPEEVTIVHAQWIELEDVYRVKMHNGQSADLDAKKWKKAKQFVEASGLEYTKARRSVVKQAFLGGKILKVEGELVRKALCGKFTWKCITGKRHRNRNQWYGIVRNMIGPQRWANKLMSQGLHIMNTAGKGPLFEEGAVKDVEAFKMSWAQPDEPTMVGNGALQNNRILQRDQIVLPTGYFQASEFAIGAVRDVSGVNLELLGQADRDQPGVLEYQRSRQAMTTLASLFANLRLYRIHQGELMLGLITDYMADGRLIRVIGEEGEKYVPLMKQPGVTQYDVIVDDAPSAPNQKEITWSIISAMPPQIQAMMTPPMWATALEYSPAPASFVEKMKGHIEQAAQNPPPNPEMMKLEVEKQKAAMQAQLKQKEAELDALLEREKADRQAQLEGAQAAADIEFQRQKSELELEIMSRKFALEIQLKQAEHGMKMRESEAQLHHKEMDYATQAHKEGELAGKKVPSIFGALADLAEQSKQTRELLQGIAKQGEERHGMTQAQMKALLQGLTADVELVKDEKGRPIGQRKKVRDGSIDDLMKALTADTEIVRDPKTGRAVGARRKG